MDQAVLIACLSCRPSFHWGGGGGGGGRMVVHKLSVKTEKIYPYMFFVFRSNLEN